MVPKWAADTNAASVGTAHTNVGALPSADKLASGIAADRVLFQVLLFPNNGVHAVTSALSQINCNIVSVTKQVRYAPMISQETTFTIHSHLSSLGHERMRGMVPVRRHARRVMT